MAAGSTQLVSWKQLSPILADVVISPWNLLVGGLLIQYLSLFNAIMSIVIGYGVLAAIFILYGGLGFKKRQQSAQILHEVFRGRFSTIFIPLLLALGQLGWAAINISLGGSSLAALIHIGTPLGMIVYTLIIAAMGSLGLYRLAYVKLLVIASSLSLVAYIGVLKFQHGGFAHLASYQPISHKSLFWGSSVVVASLISFATVSPDFFQSLKRKSDIATSTVLGVVLPGAVMCLAGCLLFTNARLDLVGLISSLSFAAVPNLFNTIANTDGSMALYTPALKFQLVFGIRFLLGIVIGAGLSVSLALLGIIQYIEVWLKVLSLLSPVFIGVAFAAVLFNSTVKVKRQLPTHFARWVYGITVLLCIGLLDQTLPVIFALIAPLFMYSLYLQYRHIHE